MDWCQPTQCWLLVNEENSIETEASVPMMGTSSVSGVCPPPSSASSLSCLLLTWKNEGRKEGKSLSHVQLFTTPWTVAYQAPPFMGFSRQEYWSGVPLPSPDLLELHPKKMSFSSQGMECKSRKSRESWSNKQVLPWRTKWSRTKTEFCQENTLVIANILFQQHKRQIYIWTLLHIKAPVFWPLDVKSWLIWKDPDAGKDWGQEEKGTTEYEMVVWHHRLSGHGFE